jgi:tRNA-splicing ligase RtcB
MSFQKYGLVQIREHLWEIPKHGAMRVPGRIYASEKLLSKILEDKSLEQVKNVACLPGIVKYSLAMPDIHWGYGFPVGGVAAFDPDAGGVISPGGIGYDINCGVRLLRSRLKHHQVKDRIRDLVVQLFRDVPVGLGARGGIKLSHADYQELCRKGSKWAVERGFGKPDDLQFIEAGGALPGADPSKVSQRAMDRGKDEIGTVGSGNHFVEIDVVEDIFDADAARAMGLEIGQLCVLIHCGSRGFGHQICDDYLRVMSQAMKRYNIEVPDRQLACAPINSPEARDYLGAMASAANYAWANRQVLTHLVRKAFQHCLKMEEDELGMDIVYDVAHNIAKFEEHDVDGYRMRLCVHRKGATRSFPPGNPELPESYRSIGQPVLIPGSMGTASYVLVGAETSMYETFGTTCHGAGRVLSRSRAKKEVPGQTVKRQLEDQGIYVLSDSRETLSEEMPAAYKDVSEVVEVVHRAGLAYKVARLRPVGVIKG